MVTLQLGNDVMVSIKAKLRGGMSGAELVARINALEVDFKRRFPEVRFSFFEPDLTDA
jgi:hypothetical protein